MGVLDEIEKTPPNLINVLLQVMDHATLTDNSGIKADFRNVVLILTTNAGAREISAKSIGFTGEESARNAKGAIDKTFSPEFRNRLDQIVIFEMLEPDAVSRVVDKNLAEVHEQLEEKGVSLEITEAARAHLAEKGFDKLFGARPMARLIEREIKKPLAEEILFGRLQKGGRATADLKDGELTLVFDDK